MSLANNCRLYKKSSAEPVAVIAKLENPGLFISPSGGGNDSTQWLYRDCSFDLSGYNQSRLKVSHNLSGDVLIIDDPDLIKQISCGQSELPGMEALTHKLKLRPWLELKSWLTVMSIIIGICLGGYLLVEATVNASIDHLPIAVDKQLGESAFKHFLKKYKFINDDKQLNRIRGIAEKLSAASSMPYKFDVYLAKSKEVNAFALPGGKIIVFSGLIKDAKSDDEIAGVLGHEIGHLKKRHSLRDLLHSVSLLQFCKFVFGDNHEDVQELMNLMLKIEGLKYNRDQESEADEIGINLAKKAGYDPNGLIHFFQRIQDEESNSPPAFILSHPLPKNRVVALKKKLADLEANSN